MAQFMISQELDTKEVYIKKIIQDEMGAFRVFAEYFTFSQCEQVALVIKHAYIKYISSFPNVSADFNYFYQFLINMFLNLKINFSNSAS